MMELKKELKSKEETRNKSLIEGLYSLANKENIKEASLISSGLKSKKTNKEDKRAAPKSIAFKDTKSFLLINSRRILLTSKARATDPANPEKESPKKIIKTYNRNDSERNSSVCSLYSPFDDYYYYSVEVKDSVGVYLYVEVTNLTFYRLKADGSSTAPEKIGTFEIDGGIKQIHCSRLLTNQLFVKEGDKYAKLRLMDFTQISEPKYSKIYSGWPQDVRDFKLLDFLGADKLYLCSAKIGDKEPREGCVVVHYARIDLRPERTIDVLDELAIPILDKEEHYVGNKLVIQGNKAAKLVSVFFKGYIYLVRVFPGQSRLSILSSINQHHFQIHSSGSPSLSSSSFKFLRGEVSTSDLSNLVSKKIILLSFVQKVKTRNSGRMVHTLVNIVYDQVNKKVLGRFTAFLWRVSFSASLYLLLPKSAMSGVEAGRGSVALEEGLIHDASTEGKVGIYIVDLHASPNQIGEFVMEVSLGDNTD